MRRQAKKRNEGKRAWRVPWWRTCRRCGVEFLFEHAWVGRCWVNGKSFVCLTCSPLDSREVTKVVTPNEH